MEWEKLESVALGLGSEAERTEALREIHASAALRAELRELEASLELIALSADDIAPSATLRDRIAASIDPRRRLDAYTLRLSHLFDLPELRVAEILGATDPHRAGEWESDRLPGLELYHLDGGARVAGADCGLVRMAPGLEFPLHGHGGDEWALVLAGRAVEDSGAVWLPGDLVYRTAGSRHRFQVLGDESLLFALVLHGGLQLS